MFENIINSNTGKFILLVGTNETGKTTEVEKFVKNNMKDNDILYVSPYVEEPVKQNKKVLFLPVNKFFESSDIKNKKFESIKNSILIFDDSKTYISVNTEETNTKIINELFIKRRFLNIQMFFVFHSFAQVPSFIFDYSTEIWIKKTFENLSKIKNRLPNYRDIESVVNTVKKNKNPYFMDILIIKK